jgi:hypothetical protein
LKIVRFVHRFLSEMQESVSTNAFRGAIGYSVRVL